MIGSSEDSGCLRSVPIGEINEPVDASGVCPKIGPEQRVCASIGEHVRNIFVLPEEYVRFGVFNAVL
jgi:hypothetical protein